MYRELSRRGFLRVAATGVAAGLAATLTPGGLAAQPTTGADLTLFNGRMATLDERRPLASAVAISDGRFVAVGTDAEVMAYRGDKTQLIDLGGRTVIPGLNDSHMHPIRGTHGHGLLYTGGELPRLT
jgi:imidazolonepropionase-like amidohydrolase